MKVSKGVIRKAKIKINYQNMYFNMMILWTKQDRCTMFINVRVKWNKIRISKEVFKFSSVVPMKGPVDCKGDPSTNYCHFERPQDNPLLLSRSKINQQIQKFTINYNKL